MPAVITSGIDQEPQACTEYPTTSGLIAAPRLPSVFMAAVIVPAASPPMSWHIAQLGLRLKSAHAAAIAMSTAATTGRSNSAGVIETRALPPSTVLQQKLDPGLLGLPDVMPNGSL
jgi:hypothetical protein